MLGRIRLAAFMLSMAGFVFAQDYETLGRNLVQDLFAHSFEKVFSQFDESWAQVMPEAKLPEYVNMLVGLAGKFQGIEGTRLEESKGYHVVYVACRFEKRTLHITVTFDSRNRVTVLAASPSDPTRPPFDEKGDSKAAIEGAVDKAAIDGIRVLVVWGANDDSGSRLFLESKGAPAISAPGFFRNEYQTVNVNVGHLDKNIKLAKSYGAKLYLDALPALTVLDSTGTVIANTNAAAMRTDRDPAGIDPAKLAGFLKSHQAPAPNAIALFEAALKQAKNENKRLFVWFSAPW